jgi:hypothetical protein
VLEGIRDRAATVAALRRAGVRGPGELAAWRLLPREGLHERLGGIDIEDSGRLYCMSVVAHNLMQDDSFGGIFLSKWSGPDCMTDDETADVNDVGDNAGVEAEELGAEWLLGAGDSEYIGRGVVLDLEGESARGKVLAYLPADEDEPMALWKVLLEDGQRIDLEIHELLPALSDPLTL